MELQLKIAATQITPEIEFDIDRSVFLLRGRSMPENAEKFYLPIISWLRDNLTENIVSANFDIALDYYNTGSFIRLMALFNQLEELNSTGNQFTIRWICEDGDQDNIDDGLSFKDVVKLPFEIIVI